MKQVLFSLLALLIFTPKCHSQIHSFEEPSQTKAWEIKDGKIGISGNKFKLGNSSLKINWNSNAILHITNPLGLDKAAKSANGGIAAWIYNEKPVAGKMRFAFKDENGKEVCHADFNLNFQGWRCFWNKFREDMGKPAKAPLTSMEIVFPESKKGGVTYLDNVEFTDKVNWQKMSDAQFQVNRTDFSLIPDFMKYRNANPDYSKIVEASKEDIETISKRLENWYLGESNVAKHEWTRLRKQKETEFIRKGVNAAKRYEIGTPLYPMATPKKIAGEKVIYFKDLNVTLLPLALDYRKNHSNESLQEALVIYDWFNDQGWADGSGLGTLCFEKLRSAGYFHSFFLLKDRLSAKQLERELNTLRWMTLFGICYQKPEHGGEVADNLRALAIPKLVYALSLTDEKEQKAALTAYRDYMDNALSYGPGYFGTFKSDGSGYHHRGAYNSAYYPHALYAGSLIAYLLHDTPYALSKNTLDNLKKGLLTYRFFCAGLDVPAGTVGRFPNNQEILHELTAAYAYAAYSSKEPDRELLAAAKRIMNHNKSKVEAYLSEVNANLAYTATVGEAEFMVKALLSDVREEPVGSGSLFMPYSGLLVVKNPNYHFNMKGFSKYVWDYESSNTENLSGRYLSNGHIEYFNLKTGQKSFNPKNPAFDWNFISGTTAIVLPAEVLKKKEHNKGFSDHRNYSDESFLAGVTAGDNVAMFALRLHDCAFNNTFRANKSVFLFDDVLLCLGSDIQNRDEDHETVTTLFQSLGDSEVGMVKTVSGGNLVSDHAGIVYAVADGQLSIDYHQPFSIAYIDHKTAPQSATYRYYMVTDSDEQMAGHLLSADSPVEVLSQNNDAHIVRHKEKHILYAALFNEKVEYPSLHINKVNIPLAYIWQEKGNKQHTLSVCEPDMRRPAVNHMGQLTEEDVVVPEKTFTTRLSLTGHYDVVCPNGDIKVTDLPEGTVIELTTVCGRNYTINLIEK